MAKTRKTKSLEMRITRLENAIGQLMKGRRHVALNASEIKSYLKVHNALISGGCGDCVLQGPCDEIKRVGGIKSGGFKDLGG